MQLLAKKSEADTLVTCYHCGNTCGNHPVYSDKKTFCCQGCSSVYELLNESNLCPYYTITPQPGIKQNDAFIKEKYAYLDDPEIISRLVRFSANNIAILHLSLPQMHCQSCIWLLEKLYRLDQGILESVVDFEQKTIQLKYQPGLTSLRKIVELLASIGYAPALTLDKLETNQLRKVRRGRIMKLGVAGFCFGNIMMLSFPDYLDNNYHDPFLQNIPFRFLSFLLALPVFFYSASEFYMPAWQGLRKGFINIDAPVFLAVVVTFLRSIYEIAFNGSEGYFDSMSGIVFFMLLGRVFQDISYKYISFEKNPSSFIPLAISRKTTNGFVYVPVTHLKKGDIILVRHNEIVPTDGILLKNAAMMDYSFVTGESALQEFNAGDKIYAGGKLSGSAVAITVTEKVENGYLKSLWSKQTKKKSTEDLYNQSYVHHVSKWFTIILLLIAATAFITWCFIDIKKGLDALTTVLIVACPCVLLLSHAFTYGFISVILNRKGIYLKNNYFIEAAQKINHLVFDKTGTLTQGTEKQTNWCGITLSPDQRNKIYSLAHESNHPKSRLITTLLSEAVLLPVKEFKEIPGNGISGLINGERIKIGSAVFVEDDHEALHNASYVSIQDELLGHFSFTSVIKNQVPDLINSLKGSYKLSVLSGDNACDRQQLNNIFPEKTQWHFNTLPLEKQEYIQHLQKHGDKVAMIGDGVNDSGALLQADLGIALAGDHSRFVPSCDVYLEKNSLPYLHGMLQLCKRSKTIVLLSFCFAIVYNSIGLYFAVTAQLSPGIAAILMPASTFSIIAYSYLSTRISAAKHGLLDRHDINHVDS